MSGLGNFRTNDILSAVFLLFFLGVTAFIYFPGLKDGFIFDDYPNLEDMGLYGGVVDYETFKSFVFNGFSGPLGRPISMASFLIDDNTWPSNAKWFKTTNLKIHLLNGLLLCWATLNLLRLLGYSEKSAVWISLISGAIWMLHPYMVSTTLYVIQRMAQLAALFMLAGLVGYFYGRLLLANGRIKAAYIWMSASLGGGTLLAVLSKENGILLPMLMLVLEFCLPRSLPALHIGWRIVFLWIPSFAVLVILGKEINFSPDAWPNRIFTQPERLLTEARIIWEYLYHLYIPRIEGRGLFQDGYQFSTGIISPPTTLLSIVGLVVLLIALVKVRLRNPLVAIGFLFFLVSHLLESTVLCLELYFEHRNYIASVFLFVPIAAFLVWLAQKTKPWISIFGAAMLLLVLSFLTLERAKLWSDVERLQLYWALSTPESPRALNKIGSSLASAGDIEGALAHFEKAVIAHPDSSLLSISFLLMKLHEGIAQKIDFEHAAGRIKVQPFDAQALVGLRRLVDEAISSGKVQDIENTLYLLQIAGSNPKYMAVRTFSKLLPYLNGKLYLKSKQYEQAYSEFNRAIPLYAETDAALSMVAEMASVGRPVEALLLLKRAEYVFENQADNTLIRSRAAYEQEFLRLYALINADIVELASSGAEKSNTVVSEDN